MPSRTRACVVLVCLAFLVGTTRYVPAHDGPEHEIERITSDIERLGESVPLLVARAVEWGVLGRSAEAIRDLERALELEPTTLHALRELGRFQFHASRREDALATVTRALDLDIERPFDRAGLLVLRAEISRDLGRVKHALKDCDQAVRLHPENPEWYLLRSELQGRLGRHRRRLADLEAGLARTGAGVLFEERVEALLDAGKFRAASDAAGTELASTRLAHRWLVRRARARSGLGQTALAREDARAALREIEVLYDPARPDRDLIVERAHAHAILGERTEALHWLDLARDRGVDSLVVGRIESRLLGASRTLRSE